MNPANPRSYPRRVEIHAAIGGLWIVTIDGQSRRFAEFFEASNIAVPLMHPLLIDEGIEAMPRYRC